jgi:hypothetical protein
VELGNSDLEVIVAEPAVAGATPDVSLPLKTIVLVLLGVSALALVAGISIPRATAAEPPAKVAKLR